MSSPQTESNQIEVKAAEPGSVIADESPLFIDGVEVPPGDPCRLYIDTPYKLYRGPQMPGRSYPSNLVVKPAEEHLEAINGMYVNFNGKQLKQLRQLPADHLAMLEHDLLELAGEDDLNDLPHQSVDWMVNDVVSGYQCSPRGTADLASKTLEKMQAALESGDTAARERLGDELIEILDRGNFVAVDDAPTTVDAEPDDLLDRLNDGKQVELGDRKTVAKVELQHIYDSLPAPIKQLVDLLYVISGRNKPMAPVLVMFGLNMASNLMGKELVGINDGGREYYPNTAFIALVDSGGNKFFLSQARKAIEDAYVRAAGTRPVINNSGDEAAAIAELRAEYDLDSGRTVGVTSTSGTVNGIYQIVGDSIAPKELKAMSYVATQRRKSEIQQAMCLNPGSLILADEAHTTISKLVGAGTGNSNIDMGDTLKLFDSGEQTDKATGKDGMQVVYDACLGLLGCSQPTTWLDMIGDMEGAATSGLIGRIQILNMADCAEVKIEQLRITPAEATSRFYIAVSDLIRLVTHSKTDEGKIVCNFGTLESGEDWAGKLYQEVADELGPVYEDLVAHYSFEGDNGQKGKVFWHAIKLTMTHCYCGLSPREIFRIRSDRHVRVPEPEHTDIKGHYVHERQHLQHLTDKLRDAEVFRNYVRLMIQMMHVNLANLDEDRDMSKLWRDICRHCSTLGKDATVSELLRKSIRVKRGGRPEKIKSRDLKDELARMMEAGVIGEYHLDDGEGYIKTVYYVVKDKEKTS